MPEPRIEVGGTVPESRTPVGKVPEPRIEAGRVGRPHGLDGGFYVTGARPRLLREGACVWLDGRTVRIVRRRGAEQRPIVNVEGIEDRTAAEALRGRALSVERSAAPALEEGEWWAEELEGCEVLDGERRVGTVRRLIELPSCEVLEVVRTPGGAREGSLLVPMVRDAIRGVDVGARTIDVDMSFVGED